MYNFKLVHGWDAKYDLFEEFKSLPFRECPVYFNVICQIASFAVLEEEVEIMLCLFEID